MATAGAEPVGSMGTDSPIAALSDKPRLLFDYFSQLFAQVTNPPLDAIREELVHLALRLDRARGEPPRPDAGLLPPGRAAVPVISNDDLTKIRHVNRDGDMPGFITHVSRGLYDVEGAGRPWRRAWTRSVREVSDAIAGGARIIVLSSGTRPPSWRRSPRCCSGAVHHHLVREPGPRWGCSWRRATSRSPPRRAAARVRRRRGEPLLYWRPSRTSPATATTSRSSPTSPCGTSSRRSARACSR
ncbi:MAG: glutamate synthase central domain-containing protein [Nocardioides sp.]